MKKILATTALVLIMAGGSYAASPATLDTYAAQPNDIRSSDFVGKRVYATETNVAADTVVAQGAEKDWDDIGEINDVILGRDGEVKAVIIGVGGFLGIGEKSVAVGMNDVKFVRNGDAADDYYLVVNASKQQLTDASAYKPVTDTTDTAATAPATNMDTAATAPATTMDTTNDTAANTAMPKEDKTAADATVKADPNAADTAANTTATDTTMTTASTTPANRPMLTRPEVTREGYQAAPVAELTADKLEGATVYGVNDEDVGDIDRLVLSQDGKIERVVLDVGGFLGIGAREIAVSMDELNIVRNADGDMRIYIDSNKAALEAQPEYKDTNAG